MDDYLDSVQTVEETKERIKEVIYIHKQGDFTMQNWISNNQDVIVPVPEELRSVSANNLSNSHSQEKPVFEKLLGLWWNVNNDSFCFRSVSFIKEYSKPEKVLTKRETLTLYRILVDLATTSIYLVSSGV